MEDRLVVKSLIQHEQWDDFQARFPKISDLSAFTTPNGESVLHLVARFGSLSFAQKLIRFYKLDDENSLVAKELWARRNKEGELCVRFERFKRYFNKSFLDKVEAVYSGDYFKHPNKKYFEKRQVHPRAHVYKLFRRYALRASFDFAALGFQTQLPDGQMPVCFHQTSLRGKQRCFTVGLDLSSKVPFLRQVYNQLDCPEDLMSPMLGNLLLFDEMLKKAQKNDPHIRAAFDYFRSKGGILRFENHALSPVRNAVMYAEPDGGGANSSPMITIDCPQRLTLPPSFGELFNSKRNEGHWLYDSFAFTTVGEKTRDCFWHELIHVVDLSQQTPTTLSRLFGYSVMCLFATMKKKDLPLREIAGNVLALYPTSDLFFEFGTWLTANYDGPVKNSMLKSIQQLINYQTHGAKAPAVASRIEKALMNWSDEDIERMDWLLERFIKLHAKSCPSYQKLATRKRKFDIRWKLYQKKMHHLFSDFFKKNKDLYPKVQASLKKTLDDLEVLTRRSTTLGNVVLSEGWLQLLKQYPVKGELPEETVFRQITNIKKSCPDKDKAMRRLHVLVDDCPARVKNAEDMQKLLSAVVCGYVVDGMSTPEQKVNVDVLAEPAYSALIDGKMLIALKEYAGFLIRTKAAQHKTLPVIVRKGNIKKTLSVHERD